MTIYITSVRIDAQTLFNGPQTARDLAHALAASVASAHGHKDPLLSEAGLRQKRTELEDSARSMAADAVPALPSRMAHARSALAKSARENTQIPDTASDLIRAEQKWRQVERILEAGGDLRAEIRRADLDTARAIAEFAPSWLEASRPLQRDMASTIGRALGEGAPDRAAGVRQAVYERIAEVTPDSQLRELLKAEVTADAQIGAATSWLDAAQSIVETGGANMLDAAINAQMAAVPPDIEEPVEPFPQLGASAPAQPVGA